MYFLQINHFMFTAWHLTHCKRSIRFPWGFEHEILPHSDKTHCQEIWHKSDKGSDDSLELHVVSTPGIRHVVKKAMVPHSSTLAWKIPWTEEPGGLQSMGSQRVRHNWATSHSLFTFTHWRRQWQPAPVFLPGEFQGWGSLVGCHLWGHSELNTTEAT